MVKKIISMFLCITMFLMSGIICSASAAKPQAETRQEVISIEENADNVRLINQAQSETKSLVSANEQDDNKGGFNSKFEEWLAETFLFKFLFIGPFLLELFMYPIDIILSLFGL